MTFANKVAIVTGAAKGIGWGTAKFLSQKGAKVVVVDWDEENGKRTAADINREGGEAIFVKCDVSNEEQVRAMIAQTIDSFGQIDILVNNAGVGVYKSILDATSEDWDHCLAVNLKGVFLCSKYAIPYMQKLGKGAIVNISSVHSHATVNGVGPYAASKGGITALTRNMAIDYGPAIRVNSLAPGWVLTPLIQSIFDSYDNPADQQLAVEKRQVMKRIGIPEDIGYAAAFLASDE